MVNDEFAGRAVLVTGAHGGLGTVLCRRFAGLGAQVLGVDVADGDDTYRADVATVEGNDAMVAEALRRFGRLDVLVLNAGLQHVAPLPEFPPERWDALHDVMLKGPFLALQAAWDALSETGGRVVVISSTSGFAAEPSKAAYIAAKTGVLGLVRAAAIDAAAAGIRINAVAPGWMRTPMAEGQIVSAMQAGLSENEALERLMARQPVKRFVEPDEVAAAVAFLASDAASGITGTCLAVDLGLLAS